MKAGFRRFAVLAASCAIATVLATSGGQSAEEPQYNRASALFPAADLQRGKTLAEPCLACHGNVDVMVGEQAFHPPKLRYQRVSTLFYALQDYRDGRRKSEVMEPIAKPLSDQDMRDLSAYLSARTARPRLPAKLLPIADSPAHRKNSEVCGMCHGETGLGEIDGYPVIAGQNQDYIEHALLAYRSGERANPIMQTFARSLKPEEVRLMAAYFAERRALEPVQ